MLLVTDRANYHPKYVMLLESIKNLTKIGCKFNKIIYSPPTMCMNGLYIKYDIKDAFIYQCKDHHYLKVDWSNNYDVFTSMCYIEEDILKNAPSNLKIITAIKDELTIPSGLHVGNVNYKFKLNDQNNHVTCIILRIIGMWSTTKCCGVTYQILYK